MVWRFETMSQVPCVKVMSFETFCARALACVHLPCAKPEGHEFPDLLPHDLRWSGVSRPSRHRVTKFETFEAERSGSGKVMSFETFHGIMGVMKVWRFETFIEGQVTHLEGSRDSRPFGA